jgi:hypothetical protein
LLSLVPFLQAWNVNAARAIIKIELSFFILVVIYCFIIV